MSKIKDMPCYTCGATHGKETAEQLAKIGWFACGLTKNGIFAQRIVCRVCLEGVMGRKLKRKEFRMP